MTSVGSAGGAGAGGSVSSVSGSDDSGDASVDGAASSGLDQSSSTDESQDTTTDALAGSPTSTEAIASAPTTSDTLSGNQCAIPDDPSSQEQVDSFHVCTSGVSDRAAIDQAQSLTEQGGCAALSEEAMLCNPAGPEIGEYTVGRPEGFPDYVGPQADFDHLYTSRASTPGGWSSLSDELNGRLQENPTPGRNQQTATPGGVVNDAGITIFSNTDMVRSSVSTDIQGRQITSNVTIPEQHMLNPGIVSQTAWSDGRSTHAIAVGEGNGIMSIPANRVAEGVFENKLESDIRVAITRDTRR